MIPDVRRVVGALEIGLEVHSHLLVDLLVRNVAGGDLDAAQLDQVRAHVWVELAVVAVSRLGVVVSVERWVVDEGPLKILAEVSLKAEGYGLGHGLLSSLCRIDAHGLALVRSALSQLISLLRGGQRLLVLLDDGDLLVVGGVDGAADAGDDLADGGVLGLKVLEELVLLRLGVLTADRCRDLASRRDLVRGVQQIDSSDLVVLGAVVAGRHLALLLALP